MLTNEFVADALQHAPKQAVPTPDWTFYKYVDCGSCKKGNEYVWVQKHDSGWTIELCYPDSADPDARVLTIHNMPVLCPDVCSAVQLAQVCHPAARFGLVWLPYW